MTTPLAPHSTALRHSIILLDRPTVGRHGHPARERLPAVVRLRARVLGAATVACTVDAAAVGRAAGVEQPTWSDLQAAWQTIAARIQAKIRAGHLGVGDQDASAVRITSADVTDAAASRAPRR